MDPLIEIDRNVRKLEIFLANNNPPLTVADLRRYLPCTVNVDPYLRKLIRGLNSCLLVCYLSSLTQPKVLSFIIYNKRGARCRLAYVPADAAPIHCLFLQ